MKKLIGIIGVAVIAFAVFFNANTMNSSNNDFDLASILNMNTANAECYGTLDCVTATTSCILLHPTDPTQDCEEDDSKWRNT